MTRTKSGHTFARVFQRNIEDTSNERDRIISVLYEANWNKAKAADLLKISRMTLYRKMENVVRPDRLSFGSHDRESVGWPVRTRPIPLSR